MDKKPSSPSEEDGRIEISVVGSPEVYGGDQQPTNATKSEAEEQSIEKKDQSPASTEIVVLEAGDAQQDGSSSSTENNSSPTIHDMLKLWQWVFIDGIQLPALVRGNELFLAVHNVQLRLLSRFPPGPLPKDIINKYTMVSHRMSAMEAWTLNSINAVMRKCELGCQLFTPEDEVVLLRDVELFYWNIKDWNLCEMIKRYEEEIKKSHDSIALMAVITAIKQHVENEIEECKEMVRRLVGDNNSRSPTATITNSPLSDKIDNAAARYNPDGKIRTPDDINVCS